MEKAENVFMLTGEFGWTDLGCWDEVQKVAESRSASALQPERRLVKINSDNIFLKNTTNKVVCTIGIKDLIIVQAEHALLICHKGESHRVREVVDILRREGLAEYL